MNLHRNRYLKRAGPAVAATVLVLVVSGSALAATVVGTPKNDVVRGTPKADKLFGKGGNDRLLGLGGNDVLVGGPGNDVLVGGPGSDKLQCGSGRDTAQADAGDKVGPDCEVVEGPVLPGVSVADASVKEGDAGTTMLSFPVTLTKPVTWAVSLTYATADGSAAAPSDYTAAGGSTITFAPGETSKTIAVPVKGDTAVEPDETFTVSLSNPVNTTIADGSATGTIRNDDKSKPHSGHYQGQTSQNRAIAFDLASDATSLTHLKYFVDISCSEVDYHETEIPIDFGNSRIPLKPDYSFSVAGKDSDSGVDLSFSVGGAITPSGSASGTLRVDITVHTDFGDVHCSTETVSWNAS